MTARVDHFSMQMVDHFWVQINTAGLIVCQNTMHAKLVHRLLLKAKQKVEIVYCHKKNSEKIINDFKQSEDTWLISVDMVTEGVDIPRLQVIVYLTHKITELFFIQVFGRALRFNTKYPVEKQDAWFFCLAHPKLLQFSNYLAHSLPEYEVLFYEKLSESQLGETKKKTKKTGKKSAVKEIENDDSIQIKDIDRTVIDIYLDATKNIEIELGESFLYQLASSEFEVKLLHI